MPDYRGELLIIVAGGFAAGGTAALDLRAIMVVIVIGTGIIAAVSDIVFDFQGRLVFAVSGITV